MDADKFLKELKQSITLRVTVPLEQQLWTEQEIADYLQLSVKYMRDNVMIHPNFPPPRLLPTASDKDRVAKRWRATDVIKFGMAYDKNTVKY